MVFEYSKGANSKVYFANHNHEFMRFYDNHRKINEELSGFKKLYYNERGEPKELVLNRDNFYFGIKRLQGFIYDNRQYIPDYEVAEKICALVDEFEESFLSDSQYWTYQRQQNLSKDDSLKYSLIHIRYLIKCFKILDKFLEQLQKTVLISTLDVEKILEYHNSQSFYEQLSNYRDAVMADLTMFKVGNSLDHFRMIIGYYYTYKFIFDRRKAEITEKYFQDYIIEYIESREVLDIVLLANSSGNLLEREDESLRLKAKEIKERLLYTYSFCNYFLSRANVLPSVEPKIYYDTTPYSI